MIEAPTTARSRTAMQRAHDARAEAMRDMWSWLFPSRRGR